MRPAARAVVVVALLLGGCRAEGGARQEAVRPAEDASVSAPEPAVTPEPGAAPEPAVAPEPAATPEPFVASDSRIQVEGRTVEVRLDEQEPDDDSPPKLSLVVSVVSMDGGTQGGLFALPTPFEGCESSEAIVEPVPGEASPLVLAQAFCERGEDEFSREILAAVVHVGAPGTAPRVLWKGGGHYRNSFGVCEDLDVPSAKVTDSGMVRIEQHTEVVKNRDPDGLGVRCKPKKLRVRTLAELAF